MLLPCLYQYIGPYKSTKYSTSGLLPSAGESAEEVPRYASIEAFVAIGY